MEKKKLKWKTEPVGLRMPVDMKREIERRAATKYQSITDWIVSNIKQILDGKGAK